MNGSIRSALAAVLSVALAVSVAACASTPRPSGFLGGHYQDLQPGPEGGVKMRWIKPGQDFSKYDKLMIDRVVFYFAPDSEDKGIDPEVMKELSDAFHEELVNAVKDRYPVVGEPGADVARVKYALTGLRQSRPVVSGVTTVIPVGLAVSAVKKGVTDSWSGSGATGMEVLVLDSVSGEVIGAGQDERTAGFTERFTRYGSARDSFKFWAGRMRATMDSLHAGKP
ncbi:MAG TPA: DUF3313 domain-containing protein [Deltaproteobacteria bacterium]|nr:DUF3313 domain-containing protein [Deltaproteobacteria bacterium]